MASRRQILTALGALGLPLSTMTDLLAASNDSSALKPVRVRTITAGLELSPRGESKRIESTLDFLAAAKRAFVNAGYEVQTLRIATNPWLAGAAPRDRQQLLARLRELDKIVTERGAILSVGPVLTEDRADDSLPEWSSELIATTESIHHSVVIASPERAVHAAAATVAAQVMTKLARTLDGGVANFRFATAANIPAGTPFFPVGWHRGPESIAIGVESASVVEHAFAGMSKGEDPTARLKRELDAVLAPIERLAREIAREHEREYLGIDTSPAPGKDRSIGAAIEALTRAPFGSAGTLEACAVDHRRVEIGECDDVRLFGADAAGARRSAARAARRRRSLLDSRPVAVFERVRHGPRRHADSGRHAGEPIAGLLRDVAALSSRLRKPLSVRLFLVPGKKAGEMARFTDHGCSPIRW